jgi:hypothetical protein
MTGGASGGEAVGVGDLCVLGSTSACADLGLLATERFFLTQCHSYAHNTCTFTHMNTRTQTLLL